MQTKTQSLTESVTNVAIGYAVAISSQLAIFPIFGIDIGIQQNLLIGAYFTAISIVRSYCVRRWFNDSSRKKIEQYSDDYEPAFAGFFVPKIRA